MAGSTDRVRREASVGPLGKRAVLPGNDETPLSLVPHPPHRAHDHPDVHSAFRSQSHEPPFHGTSWMDGDFKDNDNEYFSYRDIICTEHRHCLLTTTVRSLLTCVLKIMMDYYTRRHLGASSRTYPRCFSK